ncbi:hypothetical protein BGW80DRAFT_1253079 [Lactifluus volemus]|nr:hypothetical protein BGW80DRAFT_1253079 [Lactifluus volemus]
MELNGRDLEPGVDSDFNPTRKCQFFAEAWLGKRVMLALPNQAEVDSGTGVVVGANRIKSCNRFRVFESCASSPSHTGRSSKTPSDVQTDLSPFTDLPTFLASVPPPTPTPSPSQLPPPSSSPVQVVIFAKTCVSLPKESASRQWPGNLKGAKYVFSNALPIEEVPYCEPNLRRSQLLSSGLSFLYFKSLKPTGFRNSRAQANEKSKLSSLLLKITVLGAHNLPSGMFSLHIECTRVRAQDKKWRCMRVYACVRRKTGWMSGERCSVRPNNLAAFSFLFRLSFPEKTNSIGEEL